jgi:Domain of unknown function (DUF1905)
VATGILTCEFDARVWPWRGPSPYHFVTLSPDHADAIHEVASSVTYGWGMVPVEVRIGRTRWRTSLFPKDGGYVLPLRASVRTRENIHVDDVVHVALTVRAS